MQTRLISSHVSIVDQIHARALEITQRYKRAEADLIDVLQKVEEHRVFLRRGHASLFRYVVDELGLSESVAYNLITVARKSREVPELKSKLQSGEMTLTNARRVVSVLTFENQAEWLSKASELSGRQLEREIVRIKPLEATPERASYVSADRVKLELGLSEREMLRLRRVQDLMSQTQRKALSLEEVITALNAEYLRRHDPVEKAKRHQVRKPTPLAQKSTQLEESVQVKLPAQSDGLKKLEEPNQRDIAAEAEDIEPAGFQKQTRPESQTETLKTLVARRVQMQERRPYRQKRVPIPAAILHQVNLRDQRRCAHPMPDGSRCNQARWIEIHHKVPVSAGGSNTTSNLITLCSAHHKLMHL